MGGQQRVFKAKIKATETLAKVFRAMEMIAASRINAARKRAEMADPYTRALTQAVAAVAVHGHVDHSLTRPRTDTRRVAVLAIASDRGLAGAYSATILRETERLLQELHDEGKEPVLFTSGRRARQYFSFRRVPIANSWEGSSDNPNQEMIDQIAHTLLDAFLNPDPTQGVAEVHLVFTRFETMVRQVPEIRKMLPLTVVDTPEADDSRNQGGDRSSASDDIYPEYEFIPDASTVLNELLPLYVRNRITHAMLQSAASELASRQQAMHTATDNANDLITNYTRLANAARQAEITQEITEIVSGADALAPQA
ncbi:F0F1 ATP synthase subunit gamma [Actinomycetaceae bacterium WB03_NA08]|uniref:ATP synthase gamma chain n=1 Tax=Scrofimicrobium canadense TaxID=2652290 RepID=A0A6N7VUS9_9ACTO|nr:F0F1 ATP synthase subunit gamma [Scrofimicrobium canadense]MSS84740.1 F0F1 ATP synthase subunit gamma [Scrofimicrobium canadense]